jgi:glycosyl transferase family 25
MRLLLINLERAPERLAAMTTRLDAVGQSFTVLRATDGRCLTQTDRARADGWKRRWITEYPLTDNEIGCYLSHLGAMQELLNSGEKMLAVLEDDLTVTPELPHVLRAIEASGIAFSMIDLHRNFKPGEVFVPCSELFGNCQIGRIGYTHMNNFGYVVSRQGAFRFIAAHRRFVHAVDKAMHRYWANGLELYGLSHPVVSNDPATASMIDETRATRPRFPDADALHWRLARMLSRGTDSIRKRLCCPFYAHRGRRQRAT